MSLIVKEVHKSFGNGSSETRVLKGVNFTAKNGQFIILNGSSGSGKTTLLNILGGLLTQSAGEIIYNDHAMYSDLKKASSMRLHDIGFIFQSSHLIPYLTVIDQLVTVGIEAGMSKREAKDRARQLLTRIGLQHRLDAYPNMLSGGEKQRVAIMRAFMNQPKLILADEPTASLDAKRATEVVEMIANEVETQGLIGIMITHDRRLFSYADQLIELDEGKVISN
ncbi:ABC transporter ATP-binding protein [Staphylococcus gallinarum]|uniref:ABC transporter ATP-binding protein n=1 Tax=Staphylococcus gallinarum TaxID=1293 RepID=UPI000D1DD078|nr:ABC transporter ATP-binding protein [Staphylococcus gallinarum]MCD8821458.1 ABC transporter ATP-binding protein [Staphylococcus gallinarum]MCD8871196.1 ABC transporter ATP-binding protein [Staphylococcus gallinarum]MCW0985549.1 ABC transporter ATP-binding protein [Staphylococcus gallinarum]PTL05798.1 hemin ABC transporter ATP-binding protein [Staphylococcus gallinarum]PTL11806.1 hemin ABC transporter ATP-binding protein [Staphylococcus gallinarum]